MATDDGGGRDTSGWAAAPAAAFVFVLLRIFAVSGYQWDVAFNVSTTLSISDSFPLIFGSLMGAQVLVEVLLVILLPLLIADFLWVRHGHRPTLILMILVGLIILFTLTFTYRSWWLPAACLVAFGALALIHVMPERSPLRRGMAMSMARIGLVSGVGVLIAAAFTQTPWVPLEEIETRDGPLVGYVLDVEPGFLEVLTPDHTFLILPIDEVLSRA